MVSLNNIEAFREKIQKGILCVGGYVSFSDAAISEMYGNLGYDFTWIDTEHAPLDLNCVLGHIMAARASGAAPFVRVAANDPILIKPVLELHPAGIIVPMVNNAEQAEEAVAACKYPPVGRRGFGPRRGSGFGTIPVAEYLKKADNETLVILQIESIEAVNNLDAILQVKGVDSICIGPMDLSGSMGILGQSDRPELIEAIETIRKKAVKSDVILGVAMGYDPKNDGAKIKDLVDNGLQWISLNTDFSNLSYYSQNVLERVRAMKP